MPLSPADRELVEEVYNQFEQPVCLECKEPSETHVVNEGIGPIEVWGRLMKDEHFVRVSKCCDSGFFDPSES